MGRVCHGSTLKQGIQKIQKSVAYSHSNEIPKKFAVCVKEHQDRLPTMYWLPKLHKRLYKARFIANCSSLVPFIKLVIRR